MLGDSFSKALSMSPLPVISNVVSSSPSGPLARIPLRPALEAEPVSVAKSEIAKRATERVSIMPDDIADKVTDNGVRDVTVYLLSKP